MRIITGTILLLAAIAYTAAAQTKPQYVITVTRGGIPLGQITVELYPDVAPKHVHNFDSLVSAKFYDGTAFHRVIPGFMIQGGGFYSKEEEGAPKEWWGYADDSQTRVPAEFSSLKHVRGIVSMARSTDTNSATSQFFICVAAAPHLDGKYSIFGHVISGMDVVDTIVMSPRDANDSPLEKVEMTVVAKSDAAVETPRAVSACALAAEPNITSGDLRLRFTAGGRASLVLFDASGRAVRSVVDDNLDAGSHEAFVDCASLPSGMYTARLRAGSSVATARVAVVH